MLHSHSMAVRSR